MKRIFSMAGFPGVGKTSSLSYVKDRLPSFYIFSDTNHRLLEIQRLHLESPSPFKYERIQEIFFEIALERIECLRRLQSSYDGFFLDRGFEDTWLVTEFYASKDLLDLGHFERKYYQRIKPFFSHTVFFLDATFESIESRISHRFRVEGKSKRDSGDLFLSDLKGFYKNWYLQNSNCIVINNEHMDAINVAEEILLVVARVCMT
jgi:deoxyadenosine/deoxycytidine kinase